MVGCFHGKTPAGSTIRVEQPNMVQRMFALCSERVDLVRQIFRHSIPVSWGPHVVSPFRDPRQSVKSRDFTRDNPQRKKTKCHVHHCQIRGQSYFPTTFTSKTRFFQGGLVSYVWHPTTQSSPVPKYYVFGQNSTETVVSSGFCVRCPSLSRILWIQSCGGEVDHALVIRIFNARPI